MYNPFEGVKPSFGPFTALFGNWVGVLLGVVWAVLFVYAAVHMVLSVGRVIKANKTNRSEDLEQATGSLWPPIIGLVLLVCIPVLYAVITSNAQPA